MKTATIPSVRVEPEFRAELEAVLQEGESLSAFVEKTLRDAVSWRREQAEFHARGMASLARVRDGEPTIPAAEVIAELRERLEVARAEVARRKRAA